MKIAVFPGSFDPITIGHVNLIERALPLFDKIIIAIGNNSSKKYMFSLEKRREWIEKSFEEEKKIEVDIFEGLTVDYCQSKNANYIIRGIRNSLDLEFEKSIAQANAKLNSNIETIFLLTAPEHSFISSSIVRDVILNNGDYQQFVPDFVLV
tara:strand:+ start:78 stop:533 length:456 start_codon:yes stop_codon:yes gene_type:complete